MSVRRLDLRRQLEAAAFGQAGYFSATQASKIGYTYQAQKYHVDAGNWVRIDRGLFRLPSWPSSGDDEYVRWAMWSRGAGVISHESALRAHDLSDVDPARVHLAVPPAFRATDPLVVLHHEVLADSDIEQRRAWRITTPLRTLEDVAAGDLSQEHVDRAVSDAVQRGLATRRIILRRTADMPAQPALRIERALSRLEEGR